MEVYIKKRFRYLFSPPPYIIKSLIAGAGGTLWGLDTGMIGPVTTMSQFSDSLETISTTVHGMLVSSILITGALSSFFGGHLADAIGRPRGMMVGALVFGIGSALEAGSIKLSMLFVGRLITGLGEGLFMSTMTVYICEISPTKNRGTVASAPQFFIATSICIGYFVCYGTVNISSSLSWRLPFALQSAFAFCYAIACFMVLPHSPCWLKIKGRPDDANNVREQLGISETQGIQNHEALARETDAGLNPGPLGARDGVQRFLAVFTKDVWKPTAFGVFLMFFQQLSGIDGVLYYAPLLFQQAGLVSSSSSFLASGLSGVIIFTTTIPAILFADRWSRRASVICGGFANGTIMLTMGCLYATNIVHNDHGTGRWIIVACIFLFTFVYSVTWAISICIYASEIQPSKTRAPASSLGRSGNWVANWIVAFTTPIFLSRSPSGVYFMFSAALFLTAVVCLLWMPETRGVSLEEIDGIFRKPATHNPWTKRTANILPVRETEEKH